MHKLCQAIGALLAVLCILGAVVVSNVFSLRSERRIQVHVEAPVDYERTGADPKYRHGDHCIDMRSF